MTAVTADVFPVGKSRSDTHPPIPVMAAKTLYAGTLVSTNATGYCVNGTDTTAEIFAGVNEEGVDNSAGASGAKYAKKVKREGLYIFAIAGATQAVVGKSCYIVDNVTVGLAATTTNDICCGQIVEYISATKVRIDISKTLK